MGRFKIDNSAAGLASVRMNAGGAWRLVQLVRHLDDGGNHVLVETLRMAAEDWGIHPRTYQRWLDRALELELLYITGEHIRYKSTARTAEILKASSISRAVFLREPERLFQAGWIGVVWACFLVSINRDDKPTSRETLEELSGITTRQQREYESKTDLAVVIPNYADRRKAPGRPLSPK